MNRDQNRDNCRAKVIFKNSEIWYLFSTLSCCKFFSRKNFHQHHASDKLSMAYKKNVTNMASKMATNKATNVQYSITTQRRALFLIVVNIE